VLDLFGEGVSENDYTRDKAKQDDTEANDVENWNDVGIHSELPLSRVGGDVGFRANWAFLS
jgi:hypothetical protein